MMTMTDSAYRQVLMLRHVPSEPRKITVSNLVTNLSNLEGYKVTERTVQRDLNTLSTHFALVCDRRSKPYGWSFKKGSLIDIPVMDSATAITFDMVGHYLKEILPATVLKYLQPHIDQARTRLDELKPKLGKKWSTKFASLPEGLQLLPAKIHPMVLEQVYQGVLEGRCLSINRGKGPETVHPLGIVHRGRVIYLIATFFDYSDVRQVSLQRIRNVRLLDEPIKYPVGLTVKKYIEDGGFDYGSKSAKRIQVRLKFFGPAGDNLYETPLSGAQIIEDLTTDDNQIKIVRASVEDNWELRWWLLGFGDQVEILSPKKIRQEFRSLAVSLSKMYHE